MRSRTLILLAGAVACNGNATTGDATSPAATTSTDGDNAAPTPFIVATPAAGVVPLSVLLDASLSTDDADGLLYRFDVDGDGAFDTELSAAPTVTFDYSVPGEYWPAVEVSDGDGLTATATSAAPVLVATGGAIIANLDVDADRDGVISIGDDLEEDSWSKSRGAVFLANLDDDDGDGTRDGNDEAINTTADNKDLAAIVVRRIDGLEAAHAVVLSITPQTAATRVRLFDDTGTLIYNRTGGKAVLDKDALAARDLTLRIESSSGRTASWNGEVTLTLSIGAGTTTLAADSVLMRVAPTIFSDNVRKALIAYAMRIDSNQNGRNLEFWNTFASNMPQGVELHDVDEWDYGADRWVQDSMQTGYQEMPGTAGRRSQSTHLEAQRPTGGYGLEALLPDELLGGDLGFAYPGGRETSLNYGGNIEIAPPHEGFPIGRVIVGGGDGGTLLGADYADTMAKDQLDWFNAQGVQGPALELSTEWLAVGHLDEYFQLIPDLSGGEAGWKIVFSSPTLARAALENLQSQGHGDAVVFDGRETETTVAAILNDDNLMAFNDAAQARLDSIRLAMQDAIGAPDDAFVEVPVLYEPVWYGGYDLAVAYNPGIQNLVVIDDTLFVPDPEGPDDSDGDVWQTLARDALEPLGLTVHFVDVFDSYHLLMGEAHCGVNVTYDSYAMPWWEVEP